MKCKVCGKVVTNKSIEDGVNVKITYEGKNYYFCCGDHCGSYMKELKDKKKHFEGVKEIDEYVKKNIMLYNDNQKLPNAFFTRLNDLFNGTERFKYGETVHNGEKAGYPLEVISATFKSQRDSILYWFRNKSFQNEAQKLNYMWKIIEGNINNEYNKYLKSQVQQEINGGDVIIMDNKNLEVLERIEQNKKQTNDKKPSLLDFLEDDEL
jgi:YHS domain-containing protein